MKRVLKCEYDKMIISQIYWDGEDCGQIGDIMLK